MLIENQQFVVSATALHTSKEDRSEGVFDFSAQKVMLIEPSFR